MKTAHRDGQVTASGDAYRALLAVSEAIVSHRDLSALIHELAGRLHQVARFDHLGLHLYEAESGTVRLHVLEPSELAMLASGMSFPIGESPAGLVADPATAHHLERGRGNALAAVPGTRAADWRPELLLAPADHGPAAAGYAGFRVQAALRLRCGGPELFATRR